MVKAAKMKSRKRKVVTDDPNLLLERRIIGRLDEEDREQASEMIRKGFTGELSFTLMEAALCSAAEGNVDYLRRLVVEAVGDERVGQYINYPAGKRGQKLRRMLLEAVGQEHVMKPPTLIERATLTAQRIQ
jgi:hypothetical protein